ncbi:serine hydrolase domain-containing protein [Amycolatopsis pittospori]|uniref:serine hydrolase domain-containing protein n=1 Tax=Amycolatopsis pittospori TaxID=2749434 RepID=UPI0015F0366C|nr:serine hydrolase domain-containing protein [Amycolatopsis pittospori]
MSRFDPAGLERGRRVLSGYVERGEVPGLVSLVAAGDEVHVNALGDKAIGGTPMERDSLFRISSMTKPLTAVAAMMLVEECGLRLDEPVDDLLPELAGRRVLRRIDGPLDDTVPAARPITLRDLLTFRLGFGIVLAPPGSTPIQRAIDDLELVIGPPKPTTPHHPDEWLRRFGTLPLLHQPGERWMYQVGSEVLAILIARAAEMPFERFLAERIFEPLGMVDTGFVVAADRLHRFTTSYQADEATGELHVYDAPDGQWNAPVPFPSGGAGLVSTADDYLAFSRMLLSGGVHDGERLLSPRSVALLTADHLTAEQAASGAPLLSPGLGWGFGLAVVSRDDGLAARGRYGWDGGLGTSWAAAPATGLTGILLTQRADWPAPWHAREDFWTTAQTALR